MFVYMHVHVLYVCVCDSAQNFNGDWTLYTHSLTHPLLPISPSAPTSLTYSILSLQNGLTALEVARASTDKDWDEEEEYEGVSDYDGVVDLLSGYTAEPAVLPSHHVSGTITTSSH